MTNLFQSGRIRQNQNFNNEGLNPSLLNQQHHRHKGLEVDMIKSQSNPCYTPFCEPINDIAQVNENAGDLSTKGIFVSNKELIAK
jgi:hypothetical protein